MPVLLSDYVSALRGGWKIILGILAVAIALSFVPRLTSDAVYVTSTDLYVSSSESGELAAQRILNYVTAASGDVMADAVSDELGGSLGATVRAEAVPGTLVIRITATGSNAERVRDVASAYADVLPDVIADLEELGNPDAGRVNVRVIDAADIPSATRPSLVPRLVLAVVLGLGLGVSIVMMRDTLRRERRRTEGAVGAADQ